MQRAQTAHILPLIPLSLFLITGTQASDYSSDSTIYRDVAIIGGGGSGVYAAIRLRDYKKSVVVIEPQSRLGGHVNTYTTPKGSIDYGVVVFSNTTFVRAFFSRFNIPQVPYTSLSIPQYTDFSTGYKVPYTPPTPEQTLAALERYKMQLMKYPFLQTGIRLPYPVPQELVIPFGDFIRKYQLEAIIPLFISIAQGYSPVLNLPTLYVLKYVGLFAVESLETYFLVCERHNTQELYNAARRELGRDALLNTRVAFMSRGPDGNIVVVDTPTGRLTIHAKKILVTAQPSDIKFGGLTQQEVSLFSQFFNNAIYAAVLNAGLPNSIQYLAVDPRAPYYFPPGSPGLYILSTDSATNLTVAWYGTVTPEPVDDVKTEILNAVQRVKYASGQSDTGVEILAFAAHVPYNTMVTVEAIESGFYERLYDLQGTLDTFYSGAAWDTQFSTSLWHFTEAYLLPKILASLEASESTTAY